MIGVILIGAGVGIAAMAFALSPLWRRGGRAAPRIAHEVESLKSALREVDKDLERGALTATEAESAKRELARRLLDADAAAAASSELGRAPRRWSLIGGASVVALLVGGALGLHQVLGAPSAPDRPFGARDLAAESGRIMTQAEAEAAHQAAAPPPPPSDAELAELMRRLETVLEERPDDVQGLQYFTAGYAELGRPDKVWPALARLAELRGAAGDPRAELEIAEVMIQAAGGYVSEEARARLERASAQEPVARLHLGFAAIQRGDREGLLDALEIWTPLYREVESTRAAPSLRAAILDVAARLRLTAEAMLDRLGGAPSAALDGLLLAEGARLLAEPDDVEAWTRLVQRYLALGRESEATEIVVLARRRLEGRPDAIARVERALLEPWAVGFLAPMRAPAESERPE